MLGGLALPEALDPAVAGFAGAQNGKSSAKRGLNRRSAAYKPSEIPLIGGSSLRPDPVHTGVSCCELPVLAFGEHGGVRAKSVQISGLQHILHKRVEMKALTQSVLAAAMLMALPFASAEACNKNAWLGNQAAAAGALASGPELPAGNVNKMPRYSGKCAVRTAPGQFVTDNTPNAEGTYRARFYVYTSANGKFFTATASDDSAGAEIVGASFNGTAISFSGPTGVATVPAVPNRWYSIEVLHQTGGAFSATVQGAGAATGTTVTGTSVTGSVGSAAIGFIGSGTGTIVLDEFESTRSATTAIGRKCRGNAVATDTVISVADRVAINNEILGLSAGIGVAAGQPDTNEDGIISVADRVLVNNVILASQGPSFCGGAN